MVRYTKSIGKDFSDLLINPPDLFGRYPDQTVHKSNRLFLPVLNVKLSKSENNMRIIV